MLIMKMDMMLMVELIEAQRSSGFLFAQMICAMAICMQAYK